MGSVGRNKQRHTPDMIPSSHTALPLSTNSFRDQASAQNKI